MHFEAAARTARQVLGAEWLDRAAMYEWRRHASSPSETLFLLIFQVDVAQAFNLADAMATAALALPSLIPIDRGRMLIIRARAARKLHQLDVAEDRYRAVRRLGRATHNPELGARAALGIGLIAMSRGNLPEVRRLGRLAVRLARAGNLPHAEHEGRHGLMHVASKQGQLSVAINEAWAMFQCSGGDETREGSDLQALGQLMVDAGRFSAARKVLIAALRRPLVPGAAVVSLGGLAIASSALQDDTSLDWALQQFAIARRANIPPYALVSGLLDCAQASLARGRMSDAEYYRAEVLELGARFGLNEYVIRAESLDTVNPRVRNTPQPSKLSPSASGVVLEVERMATERLPRQVALAAAGVG